MRLQTLEAGRAVAALAVLAHHSALSANHFSKYDTGSLLDWGAHGVDFFFVLSGFIIFHVHRSDPRGWTAARRFLWRRVRRIYVPYLPISLAVMLAYWALPGLSQADRPWSVLTSLTLLPTALPPALSVAWTLSFEMIFYLFFFATFYFGNFPIAAAGWGAVVIGHWAYSGAPEPGGIVSSVLSPLVLEFLAGVCAAYLFSRIAGRYWWVFLLLSGAGIALFISLSVTDRAFLGLAFAPLVLGLAMVERQLDVTVPAPMAFLGAASYSIYLVHDPIVSLTARLVHGQSWPVVFVFCGLAGLLAGICYHLWYEKPALRVAQRLSPRREELPVHN